MKTLFIALTLTLSTLAHADPFTGSAVVGGIVYGSMGAGTSTAAESSNNERQARWERLVAAVCSKVSTEDADALTMYQGSVQAYNSEHPLVLNSSVLAVNEIIAKARGMEANKDDVAYNLAIAQGCLGN